MFCRNCGKELREDDIYCSRCGKQAKSHEYIIKNPTAVTQPQSEYTVYDPSDKKSAGLSILSFLIPSAGLIMFLIWYADKPLRAKSCGMSVLFGYIANIFFSVITISASGLM